MSEMWNLLKELLREETKIVTKYRSKNLTVVKPSSVVAVIFAILYLLSPIDLVPEAWIHPSAFGYIDDIIVIALVAVYIYGDVGGIILNAKVQPERVSKSEPVNEQNDVLDQVRPDDNLVPVSTTSSDISSSHSLKSLLGSIDVSDSLSSGSGVDDKQVIVNDSKPTESRSTTSSTDSTDLLGNTTTESTEDLFRKFFGDDLGKK